MAVRQASVFLCLTFFLEPDSDVCYTKYGMLRIFVVYVIATRLEKAVLTRWSVIAFAIFR